MRREHNIKFINAQQARMVYGYRNIKEKLLKTNASIWFNKICRSEQLQPKYVNIKVFGTKVYENFKLAVRVCKGVNSYR
jgi:hypothetical protein